MVSDKIKLKGYTMNKPELYFINMDIDKLKTVLKTDYNPFDTTRRWLFYHIEYINAFEDFMDDVFLPENDKLFFTDNGNLSRRKIREYCLNFLEDLEPVNLCQHENAYIEKETAEILKDAQTLHEDIRNYGNIEDKNKPLIVSGILLALREIEHGFSLDKLTGDKIKTDGAKIYEEIENNLKRANVSPEVKRDKLLSQFSVIKDNTKINEINSTLGKTPIKYFAEFLYESIFKSIRFNSSAEDYLGRFYGEFMSYSGGGVDSVVCPDCNLSDLEEWETDELYEKLKGE